MTNKPEGEKPKEYKRCRHALSNGRFYKGNCEDCVIERYEACFELNEIYTNKIKALQELNGKLVGLLDEGMKFETTTEEVWSPEFKEYMQRIEKILALSRRGKA